MIQDEIHRAGIFVEIARERSQGARKAGSKLPAYLSDMAELKFEMTSGYPQDAERR
jgi:hypothetical protein